MNLFDIIVLAIILLIVVLSAKKGFVSSCLDTFSVVISAFASYKLCSPVSEKLYDFFIRDLVKTEFRQALDEMSSSLSVRDKIIGMIEALPESAVKLAEGMGFNINSISSSVLISGQNNDEYLIEELANTYGYNIMITVVEIVVFILLFVIFSLLIRFVSNFFSTNLEKVPLVGKANTLLGAVIGLVKAIVIVFAGSALIYIIAETAETGSVLEQIEASEFYIFMKENNPIIQIFNGGAI